VSGAQVSKSSKSDFRIPGHDCMTQISCSHSPAVTTLIIKFQKEIGQKHFKINKFNGVGIELVLQQPRTPEVEKKKRNITSIELVLPQSRTARGL